MVKLPKISFSRKKSDLDLGGLSIDTSSIPPEEIDFSDIFKKQEESKEPKMSVIVVKDLQRSNLDIIAANIRANNIVIIKINIEEFNIRPESKEILETLKTKISAVSGKIYQLGEDTLLVLPNGIKLVKFEASTEEE